METPSPDDLSGRILGGRYRVERPLRRGGMGAVYVARDLQTDSAVALKVVRQSLIEDPQALARFKREARLTTELSHPNIVRCLDTGDDGGLLYIAMELLEGETLRERLDARGRMSWQDTLPLIEQIVRALGIAHARGVVHRDLKPENVMLVASSRGPDQKEHVKLLDFGVAKQARVDGESGNTSMTGTGFIVGTPGYVAPEVVLEGKTDDPRTDFYALGVVWFEMLTGQKPFTAKTAFALAMRHAHEPPPTPTSFVPFSPVPAPIERLVLELMSKQPEQRPADCDALLAVLVGLAVEAERALLGTPTPGTFEPGAFEATLTDARFAAGQTGVVPFTPSSSMPGEGTPPTMQQPSLLAGLAAMTPLPVSKDPKRRALAALAVIGAVVVAAAVGGSVMTWHLFVEKPKPVGSSSDAREQVYPPPEPASAQGSIAQALPGPRPAEQGGGEPSAPAAASQTTTTPVQAQPPAPRIDTKPPRPVDTITGLAAVDAPAAATGKATLKLKVDSWDLLIDGAKVEGRRQAFELDAGTHKLVFSSETQAPIEKVLVLKPGERRTISGPDDIP